MANCLCTQERVILVLQQRGKWGQNKMRVRARIVRYNSTYINSFLTWHTILINKGKHADLHKTTCLTSADYILPITSETITLRITILNPIIYMDVVTYSCLNLNVGSPNLYKLMTPGISFSIPVVIIINVDVPHTSGCHLRQYVI